MARNRNVKSAEDITKAYVVSNEQRFKSLRDLSMAIEDARSLGLSENEISAPLKRAKTPKYKEVMNGRFVPFFPSKETILQAQKETDTKAANPIDMRMITREATMSFGERLPVSSPATQTGILFDQDEKSPSLFGAPKLTSQPGISSLFKKNQSNDALRQVELNKLMGIV